MQQRTSPASDEALLVVDPQVDFCPGGALAVPGGDRIVPRLSQVGRRFAHVILTQDWHPAGHASFASSHPGRAPFESVAFPYGPQTLWPDHCVQDTAGAAFHPGLDLPHAALVLRKGLHPAIDSYSAFLENDRRTATGLGSYLRERGIRKLVLAGLALDFCVHYSALDARAQGFEVVVLEDASAAIDLGGSLAAARRAMAESGALLSTAAEQGLA